MTPKNKKKARKDAYQEITNRMITLIEKGVNPWSRGFAQAAYQAPRNAASKNPYNGINVLNLSLEQADNGYSANVWLTYLQAKALGGNIKAGEKSCVDVIYFQIVDKRTEAEKDLVKGLDRQDPEYKEIQSKTYMMLKYSAVFNIDQTENIPDEKIRELLPPPPKTYGHTPIEAAENIAAAYIEREPVTVEFSGEQPSYSPSKDKVKMPGLERYERPERFYKTLFHELAHSTGHKTRLSRVGVTGANYFGNTAYSYEELIAELSAAYLSALAGTANEHTEENTAAYLKGWIEPLKNDKKMIVKAAAEAVKAVEYIMEAQNATAQ